MTKLRLSPCRAQTEPGPSVDRAQTAPDPRPTEFLARFENAYSEKDVDAAMRLVEMAGAADARRTEKKFRAVFERAFDQRIRRLWFRPPDGNAPLEYMHAGTRYRPNLPIVATLVIEFDISDPAAATSATLPVGRNADGLRFVTSVPAI